MKLAKSFLRALGRVPGKSWAWIHFKIVVGMLMPAAVLEQTPLGIEGQPWALIVAWMTLTATGGVLSVAGIIMSEQPVGRTRTLGVSVELTGLIFMFSGPFLMFVAYVYDAFTPNQSDPRLVAITFLWGLSAAMVARIATVLPRYRREAHDTTKGE